LFHVALPRKISLSVSAPALFSITDSRYSVTHHVSLPAQPKGTIPLIGKESGLIGYPSYTNDGVECSALYNPDFELGGYFELKTILPHASGIWKIAKLEHKLSAYVPNGTEWETHLSGVWVQESKDATK
jgi:hypothetical protein